MSNSTFSSKRVERVQKIEQDSKFQKYDYIRKSSKQQFDLWIHSGVIISLFFSVLAIGTVHYWPTVILAIIVLLTFLRFLVVMADQNAKLWIPFVGWAFLISLVVSVLQSIRLPASWIKKLSFNTYSVFETSLAHWGTPEAISLSLSPTETLFTFMQGTILFLFIILCSNYYHRWYRSRKLLKAVIWLALTVFVIGVFQSVLEIEKILGFYTPKTKKTVPFFLSTFVNPNNLGSLFGMICPVALGYSLIAKELEIRLRFALIFVLLSLGVFLSLSKGAILAWIFSTIFFLIVLGVSKFKKKGVVATVLALVMIVLFVAFSFFHKPLERELLSYSWSEPFQEKKMEMAQSAIKTIKMFPLTGIGRGTFGEFYPGVTEEPLHHTYHFVENEYLQLVVDFGIPIAVLLLLLISLSGINLLFVGDTRYKEKALNISLLISIVFAALHANVDFNLQTMGVALPFWTLFSIAITRNRRISSKKSIPNKELKRSEQGTYKIRFVLAVVLVLIILNVLFGVQSYEGREKKKLNALTDAVRQGESSVQVVKQAHDLIIEHPCDGFLQLLVGIAHLKEQDPSLVIGALPWFKRAMFFHPTDSRPHLYTAKLLVRLGHPKLAISEFFFAFQYASYAQVTLITREILRTYSSADELVRILPPGKKIHERFFNTLQSGKDFELMLGVSRLMMVLYPDSEVPMVYAVKGALYTDRLELAGELVHALIKNKPAELRGYELGARYWIRLNAYKKADDLLKAGLEIAPKSSRLLSKRLALLLEQGPRFFEDPTELEHTIQKLFKNYHTSSIVDKVYESNYHYLKGKYLYQKGKLKAAEKRLQNAIEIRSQLPAYYLLLGEIREAKNDRDGALSSYRRLLKLVPDQPTALQRIRRLEEQGL